MNIFYAHHSPSLILFPFLSSVLVPNSRVKWYSMYVGSKRCRSWTVYVNAFLLSLRVCEISLTFFLCLSTNVSIILLNFWDELMDRFAAPSWWGKTKQIIINEHACNNIGIASASSCIYILQILWWTYKCNDHVLVYVVIIIISCCIEFIPFHESLNLVVPLTCFNSWVEFLPVSGYVVPQLITHLNISFVNLCFSY